MSMSVPRCLLLMVLLAAMPPAASAEHFWFSDDVSQDVVSASPDQNSEAAIDDIGVALASCQMDAGGEQFCEEPFCEQYGDCQPQCECPADGYCECPCEPKGSCYADVEFMALRPHFSEEVVGKLAEKYEFSPRFVIGYEKNTGNGVRLRYWTYDRTTPNLQGGSSLGVDFQVTDLEGTHRITSGATDLILSGGIRWSDIQFEVDGFTSRNDMPGATFAADVHTTICCKKSIEWSGVGGIRWSVMGGDWEGSDNGLIAPTRDDNITVQEIYGGFECRCHRGGSDLYGRLVMEAQNWNSDVLGLDTGVDSIGFIGPGLYLGLSR